MALAVCIDTVTAFIMILLAFPALMTIPTKRLNIVTALLCCALCANFLMMDLTQISDFGRRGPKTKELKLTFLLFIYFFHTLGILLYGADFYIKSKLKPHVE